MNHPFIKYGQAIICVENDLASFGDIEFSHIRTSLITNMETFRCLPSQNYEGKEKVRFNFKNEEVTSNIKNLPDKGIFLSPHIISTDGSAKTTWKYAGEIAEALNTKKAKTFDALNATSPMAGDYIKFTDSGGTSKSSAKLDIFQAGFSMVSTLAQIKPVLQYRIEKKPRPDLFNVCIIPDLSQHELIDFVLIYNKIIKSKLAEDLFLGDVLKKVEGKKGSETIKYQPKRPLIFRGNFPNPPRSSALGSVALLGAIGEFAKEAEVSSLALKVLDSLKEATMYMIKSGGASTFTYNHHVVDLAKEGKLREIVDSVYYTQLYNEGRRKSQSTEYQKFDLFASRFLQLFNRPSFRDFLSHRAEYPFQLYILFNTYFKKIEMIDPEIVASARKLGRWLNQVAYFAAKREVNNGSQNYWEELRKAKSKVLIELESSTFSAKTGDALIAQAITRAGRISGMDAPEGATLFMEKTASGDLALENAKNLLIAFSRLKNKTELKEQPTDDLLEDDAEQTDESNDLSND